MTLGTVEQKLFTYKIDLQMPARAQFSTKEKEEACSSKKEVSPVTACFVKGEKWL